MAKKKRKQTSARPTRPAEAPRAFIRYEGCSLWAVALYLIFGCYFGTSQVSARRNYPLAEGEMNNIGEKENTPRGHFITLKLGMLDRALAWDRTARNYLLEQDYIYPFDIFRRLPGYLQLFILF